MVHGLPEYSCTELQWPETQAPDTVSVSPVFTADAGADNEGTGRDLSVDSVRSRRGARVDSVDNAASVDRGAGLERLIRVMRISEIPVDVAIEVDARVGKDADRASGARGTIARWRLRFLIGLIEDTRAARSLSARS